MNKTVAQDADYSTREVAEMLGMAVRSVQLMVDRGDLHAWKTPGGHRRIARGSVEALLARRQGREPMAGAEAPAAVPPSLQVSDARTRVLLIEDSKHYQNLASLLLREQFPDLDIQMADDGFAGLAMAGQWQPELLIVDILLPGMDGATLIMSLRSHPQFAASRLIVLTSLDEADRLPYMFALEGLPIVHKSRMVLELPQRVRDVLALPSSARP